MSSKLRSVIKQARPFDSLEQEAYLMLARASSELDAAHAELFRSAGVTWTQYNVLRILRGSDASLSCGEIGQRMVARDADVTRLLDRLERQGLVTRSRDDQDRRVVNARITERGRELLDDLAEPVAAMHRAQLGHLGEDGLRTLISLLEEVAPPTS